MVKHAVILAAGMGTRLHALHKEKPKAFIEFDNKPLIIRSIELLLSVGIQKIYIGVGHKKAEFEALQSQYPIECFENPDFATTGSLATLIAGQTQLKNKSFLLLESDLLYEKQALWEVIDTPHTSCILASPITEYGDEVYIETSPFHRLTAMSKSQSSLHHVDAVLVGISKINPDVFQELSHVAQAGDKAIHYEDGLVAVSKTHPIAVIKRDIAWCEIDTPEHFEFAKQNILPQIYKKETFPLIKRNILLNPGPATTTDTVKYAQVVPDICPREGEFGDILEEIRHTLTTIVADPKTHTTILLGGSGTAAVDAMLSSVCSKAVLVISNGAYGKRMAEIVATYSIEHEVFESDPIQPLKISDLEKKLQENPNRFSHVAMVHHETTTGLLNDIEAVGVLCKKYNLHLSIDAVSSYGAIPIDMKKMNVTYLASTSNKNLQGMAGIAFVIAEKEAFFQTKTLPAKNYYLHLWPHFDSLEKTKQTRFTPPVQTVYALRQALLETLKEGVENRYKRYTACWETLINGLEKLGLKMLVDKTHHGKLITTICEPSYPKYNFNDLHDFLYEYGITIYPGKLSHATTFRIANIGEITPSDIEKFLDGLGRYLKLISHTS